MKSKFLVGFLAYIKLFKLHDIKMQGQLFPFFFLVSTSFDTFSPAIYLKEFVIATIFSVRMTNEKRVCRFCRIYVS